MKMKQFFATLFFISIYVVFKLCKYLKFIMQITKCTNLKYANKHVNPFASRNNHQSRTQ